MSKWFNQTGGALYHLKALRFRRRLWRKHIEQVDCFLKKWPYSFEKIILVGPSAGWSLPLDFLESFQKIIVIEPDPLARWILSLRLNRRIEIDRTTYFDGHDSADPLKLDHLHAQYGMGPYLFCNLLGQLPFILNSTPLNWNVIESQFETFLKKSDWASYHDLWSTNQRPAYFNSVFQLRHKLDLFDSVHAFFRGSQTQSGEIHIRDHMTRSLFPTQLIGSQWIWNILPNEYHCIEALYPETKK